LAELAWRPFSAAPDEIEALLGALHRTRRTFAWKVGGLDVADRGGRQLGVDVGRRRPPEGPSGAVARGRRTLASPAGAEKSLGEWPIRSVPADRDLRGR
jgi:hypothetical protein